MTGLNVTDLREELRNILGEDDTGLPNTKADLLLNRSWWKLQNMLNLPVNQIDDTLATIAGTKIYAVTFPTEAILTMAFQNPDDGKLIPLVRISEEGYDSVHDVDVDAQARPEKFYVWGNEIVLEPTPDAVYTLHYRRKELVTDISDANPTLSADASLHEVILNGAAQRGFISQRNFNAAQRMKAEWKDSLETYTPQRQTEEEKMKFAQVKLHRSNEYKP